MDSSSSPSDPLCSLWLFSVSSVLNPEKRDENVRALQALRRLVVQKAEPQLQGSTSVLIRSGISPTGMRVISFISFTSMADTDLVPQVES